LSLIVGLLAGALNRAALGRDVIDFTKEVSSATNTGQAIAAISIDAFLPATDFKRYVDQVIRDIRNSQKLPGVERIWLPGEQSHTKLQDRRAHGVPIPKSLRDKDLRVLVNPTGRFVIGGPKGDAGLTGRKIIADTYGGMARHGGGAFSGKDPTKVDRSAAYAARYVAKNVVAAGLAERCEVQVAYAIGVAHPVSVLVETFGTGVIPEEKIAELVGTHFDLRPAAIIHNLNLRRPIYKQTAAYGHFGRPDLDLPWEKTDKAEALRSAAGLKGAVEKELVRA